MKIAITGITGFIGTNLSRAFSKKGFEVIPLYRADVASGAVRLAEKMSGAGVVINLAGEPIAARWTMRYKQKIYDSRVTVTNTLCEAFRKMSRPPSLFISTSAVGFYADNGKQDEEHFVHAGDFLGKLTSEWERAALNALRLGIRTIIFRFGIVLGKDGGILGKMLLPFKLGLGGIIGDGSQSFSWVQIRDLEQAYLTAIADGSFIGIYNLTSPNPTTNRNFTRALGKALQRPTFLPVPVFLLRIAFGEGADVMVKGQEVYPKRLLETGFRFQYPDIGSAIAASL